MPFSQGQLITITNASEGSGYPNCTFSTENSGDGGKAVVASVGAPASHAFTYLQPCSADPGGMAAVAGMTEIQGSPESSDFVDATMYNFYVPVSVGTGALNNTIRLAPGSTTGTTDIIDAGTATDFTVNGGTAAQVHEQIGVSSPSADIFDVCASAGCSSSGIDRIDKGGNFFAPSANLTGSSGNAGFADFYQGNMATPNASSVGFQAPSMVTTAFHFTLPGAPAQGILRGDGTSPVTLSLAELSGDATSTTMNVVTVGKVNGVTYPVSPSMNTVPVVTATNTATYETVPVLAGGTGASTAAAALINLFPAASEPGDLVYCAAVSSGACTAWNIAAGNTTGSQMFTEASNGTPSWKQAPTKAFLSSTSTYTTTSSTPSTIMAVAVSPALSYAIHCRGLWQAASSGEFTLTLTGPSSPTLVTYHFNKCNTISSNSCTYLDYVGTGTSYPSNVGATAVGTANQDMPWELTIGFTAGSSGGSFFVQGSTTGMHQLTVEAGSFCTEQ